MRVRLLLTLSFSLFAASFLHAEAPVLLSTAVKKLVNEDDRWAYTQVMRRTDKDDPATVAKFDPTRPAGQQWQLVKLKGRTPTSAEADRWCRRRCGEVNQTDGRALVDLLDLDRARVADETGTRVRYEVPLKKNTIARVPTENFVAFAEVDRADESLLRFSVVLRQAIRLIGGVAEIQSAQGDVFFTPVGEGSTEGSRPNRIVASGSGKALFRNVNRSAEIIYTDQRRVKS